MKNKNFFIVLMYISILIIFLIIGAISIYKYNENTKTGNEIQSETDKENLEKDSNIQNSLEETEKLESSLNNTIEMESTTEEPTQAKPTVKVESSNNNSTPITSDSIEQYVTTQTTTNNEKHSAPAKTETTPQKIETTTPPKVEEQEEQEQQEQEEQKIQEISISILDTNLIIGKSYQITTETVPNGLTAKGHWEISNNSIVSIDNFGKASGLKKGETNITYVTDDGIRSNTLTVYPYYNVSLNKNIYNKNGIKITAYEYMYGRNGTKDACLYMKIENSSGKTVTSYTAISPEMSFDKSGLLINGKTFGQYETQPTIMASDINGKKGNTYICIKPEALNNKGIEKVNTISFYLVLQNSEDYSKIDITDLITINL